MFERFTSSAISAMVFATSEARLLRHDYIGTEHIFLGLIGHDGSSVQRLKQAGVSLMQAREDVKAALLRKPTVKEQNMFMQLFGSSNETPFTAQSKQLLDIAWQEAKAQGKKLIGEDHLLLALLKCEGPAKDIIKQNGVDLTGFASRRGGTSESC